MGELFSIPSVERDSTVLIPCARSSSVQHQGVSHHSPELNAVATEQTAYTLVRHSLQMNTFVDLDQIKGLSISINAFAAAGDVTIAAILCTILHYSRTGFSKCVSLQLLGPQMLTSAIDPTRSSTGWCVHFERIGRPFPR